MTTQQTPEVPRNKIPQHMWEEIRAAEKTHEHANANWTTPFLDTTLREDLIHIGGRHGFTEGELIRRGIITPREKPNPEADSEHHR
jgi:hypothetical protein